MRTLRLGGTSTSYCSRPRLVRLCAPRHTHNCPTEKGGPVMTTVTVMRHRLDLHNSSVSFAADAALYCGFLHVAGGRICLPPTRHAGACRRQHRRVLQVRPTATVIRPLGAPMPANVEHSHCALSPARFPATLRPRFGQRPSTPTKPGGHRASHWVDGLVRAPCRCTPNQRRGPCRVQRAAGSRDDWPGARGRPSRRPSVAGSGFSQELAQQLAATPAVDIHALPQLVDRGCPPELAARILSPLATPDSP
jgi:hypothetical protein